jgi:Domain of unknown function (DUF5666)
MRTSVRRVGLGGSLLSGFALAALALLTGAALGATPVSGFVSGQVVSVKGGSFVVKDSFGAVSDSTISLSGSSTIIEQVSATRSALKDGVCVMANGAKASSGAVDAQRVTISAPVKGTCSNGFFGHGGPGRGEGRPTGTSSGGAPPAHFTGFGNFGFAVGSISAVKGSTVTVHGTGGSTKVTLSASTQLLQMLSVGRSAIKADQCVSVRGTSSNNGATVKATSVNLSQPGSTGCNRGFPGRP